MVGFSGHRQIAHTEGLAGAITGALALLKEKTQGEWLGLSSVAEGGDQLFVAQVRKLGMSWHAILPLPKAEFAKDFSREEWALVEDTLERAEHVRVITENGTREDAYLDCGMATVDGADVLLAVWDGEPARGKGGTADVVSYARSIGKPLILIDSNTLKVSRENLALLEHTDTSLAKLNKLPSTPRRDDRQTRSRRRRRISAFQQKCDHAASKGAPQFRRLIVLTVLLHVAATLIAAAALLLRPASPCRAPLAQVPVSLRRARRGSPASSPPPFAPQLGALPPRSRNSAGPSLPPGGFPGPPLFSRTHRPARDPRAPPRALHILHSRSSNTQPVPIEEFRDVYVEKRIDDQLAYFRRQEARALPMFNRLKMGFWIATLLALTCTLAYAVCHTARLEVPYWLQESVFYFLPISLPIVAAALISLISINDLQRRVARYREMQVMLEDSRKRVAFCQTWNSLERVVLKTERALLQEVIEWHSLTSFAESH